MRSSLNRYKIGFAILGVLTLALLVVVILQAGGAKQDNLTYKKATEVADKLNSYTQTHPAPADLSNIGVSDIPSTIAYKKIDDGSYKFCVTYHTKSANFSASDVEMELLTGGAASAYNDDVTQENGDKYFLTIDSSHNKGQQCQTITTDYINPGGLNIPYGSDDSGSSGSQSQLDKALQQCDNKYPPTSDGSTDDAYFKCTDDAYNKYGSQTDYSSPNTFSN